MTPATLRATGKSGSCCEVPQAGHCRCTGDFGYQPDLAEVKFVIHGIEEITYPAPGRRLNLLGGPFIQTRVRLGYMPVAFTRNGGFDV
jgi:hypothetical protein